VIARSSSSEAAIARLSSGAALAVILLLLDAAVAYGDPSFLLTESKAGRGDEVPFSISGTEEGATYALQVGATEVAQGSDPDGNGISGEFTMPDLGDTTRTVTVEARVTQSDETTAFTRTLLYLALAQAVTAPSEAQPGAPATETPPGATPVRTVPAALPQAPTLLPGTGRGSPPRARKWGRAPLRRTRSKARARPGPPGLRERHPGGLRSTGAPSGRRGRRSLATVVAGVKNASGSGPAGAGLPATRASKGHPPTRRNGAALRSTFPPTTLLTVPPGAPAIFALAAGAADHDSPGVPVLAVLVSTLLGLAALALAGAWPGRKLRPAGVRGRVADDDDDEVLHGLVHVPRLRGPSGKTLFAPLTALRRRQPFTAREARKRQAAFRGRPDDDDEALQGSRHVAGSRGAAEGRPPRTP
jgi:hypothetical protein